jgi:hypothetical protein
MIYPGQSNPDIIFNENMYSIDALMIARAKSMFATDPDAVASSSSVWAATNGNLFIVPRNAVGDWDDQQDNLAIRVSGSWSYVTPYEGMQILVEYDLLPYSAGTRAAFPLVVEYTSVSGWGLPKIIRNKYGITIGKDEIFDSYTGIEYFGYPGTGGNYAGALSKIFLSESYAIAQAVLKGVTPGDYYEPLYIVRDSNTRPPGIEGSDDTRFPYVASMNNFGFKYGNLYLPVHAEASAPDINAVSDVVASGANVGVLSVSNGADGYTKGDLLYTFGATTTKIAP